MDHLGCSCFIYGSCEDFYGWHGWQGDCGGVRGKRVRDQLQLSDSKTHLNKFERNNVDLPFMPLTENLYKIRITHDNACKINFKQFKALFLISDRGGRFLFRFIFEVFLIYFIWYVLTVSANFWYDSSIEPFFSLFLVSRSNFGMFRFFFSNKIWCVSVISTKFWYDLTLSTKIWHALTFSTKL